MSESVLLSNIDKFYKESLQDSNVVTVENIKEQLKYHLDFDWTEFSKPMNQIDWVRLVKTINFDLFDSEWSLPKMQQSQSKSNKQGNIFGLGKKGNVLLIKGLTSKFSQHNYQFGDEKQKKQLTESIESLNQQRQILAKEFKNLSTGKLNFELYSETRTFQTQDALEQLKYIELIRYIIKHQVLKTQDPQGTIPEQSLSGFIQTKYDDYYKEDVTKLILNCNLLNPYTQSPKDKLTIIQVQNPNQISDDDFNISYIDQQCNSIQEILNNLKLKDMDVVIELDSCVTKKNGRELSIMPRFKLLSAITRDKQQFNQKHAGLRLLRKRFQITDYISS